MAKPSLLVLAITYLTFISLGLPDAGVLGVAWPQIRGELKLPLEAVGIITLSLTLLAAGASFVSGNLTKRFATGPLILVSVLLTSGALFLWSTAPSFLILLLAAIPLGLGGGSVDSGLNAYVAKHYSARHMNWLHSFWGGGATLGPIIMTAALGVGVGWRGGYLWLACAQAAVALILLVSLPLWNRNEKRVAAETEAHDETVGTLSSRSGAAWLSVAIYVLYSAGEMGAGLWANTVLIDSRHVDAETAGFWVAAYFAAIMGGRLLVGIVVNKLGNRKLITWGLAVALVGIALFFVPALPGLASFNLLALVGLVLTGLGFAPVFPCLMHETPRRFTAEAAPVVIGRQVGGAYLGGAFLPGLLGWIMAHTALETLAPMIVIAIIGMLVMVGRLNRMS
jgi:fucose permease